MIGISSAVNIIKFFYQVLSDRNTKVKGWKEVYALYCKLDDLINASELLILQFTHFRPYRADYVESPKERALWIEALNDRFKEFDNVMKSLLLDLYGISLLLEIYDKDLRDKFYHHFYVESHWVMTFLDLYHSGQLSEDATKLTSKTLKFMKKEDMLNLAKEAGLVKPEEVDHPGFDYAPTEQSRAKEAEITLNCVTETEDDVSEDLERLKLVESGKKSIAGLKETKVQFAEFIRENCDIKELL